MKFTKREQKTFVIFIVGVMSGVLMQAGAIVIFRRVNPPSPTPEYHFHFDSYSRIHPGMKSATTTSDDFKQEYPQQ